MSWLTQFCDDILDAPTDLSAARLLHLGGREPSAMIKDRVKFLRNCWRDCPRTIEHLKTAACRSAAQVVADQLQIDIAEVLTAFQSAVNGNPLQGVFHPEEKSTHHQFVYHGLRHLESITHYNPWSDSLSRAGRLLSNMANTPFELYGVTFASAESFLQSMRLSPQSQNPSRRDVGQMPGPEAQEKGREAKKRFQQRYGMEDPVWLWGDEKDGPIERDSVKFRQLMVEAIKAKVHSHEDARKALAACSDLPVIHYVRRRGRYRIDSSSHLPPCLSAVLNNLQPELPKLSEDEKSYWLRPSSVQ